MPALGRGRRYMLGDAAAERVPAQDELRGRGGQDVGHAALEGDRPDARLGAVPAEVGDERVVGLVVQLGQDRVPGTVGPAEAMEQYQRLGHLS